MSLKMSESCRGSQMVAEQLGIKFPINNELSGALHHHYSKCRTLRKNILAGILATTGVLFLTS